MKNAINAIVAYLQSKQIPCKVAGNFIITGVSMEDFSDYGADPYDLPQTEGFSHEWETSFRIEIMAW